MSNDVDDDELEERSEMSLSYCTADNRIGNELEGNLEAARIAWNFDNMSDSGDTTGAIRKMGRLSSRSRHIPDNHHNNQMPQDTLMEFDREAYNNNRSFWSSKSCPCGGGRFDYLPYWVLEAPRWLQIVFLISSCTLMFAVVFFLSFNIINLALGYPVENVSQSESQQNQQVTELPTFNFTHDDDLEAIFDFSTFPPTTPSPTSIPTSMPSEYPSSHPSIYPSESPTSIPTTRPSLFPSIPPSFHPTTLSPTQLPTPELSALPSFFPSPVSSVSPSTIPSLFPSLSPSFSPLASSKPTTLSSSFPSSTPTVLSSSKPSIFLSNVPSFTPSLLSSSKPSTYPSNSPSTTPPTPEPVPSITYFTILGGTFSDTKEFESELQTLKSPTEFEERDNIKTDESEFIIHLGNFHDPSDTQCSRITYWKYRDLLISESNIPIFMIMGDEDIADCVNPQESLSFWNFYFPNIYKYWETPLRTQASIESVRGEDGSTPMFGFLHNHVLFVGLDLSIPLDVNDSKRGKMRKNLEFINDQYDRVKKVQKTQHESNGIAMVLFGNREPPFRSDSGSLFFFFSELSADIENIYSSQGGGIIEHVLYFYLDDRAQTGKTFESSEVKNILFVSIESSKLPLTHVTIDTTNTKINDSDSLLHIN